MKTHSFKLGTALLLTTFCALFGLSSCASLDAPNQEAMLSASGFRVWTPESAKQRELYTAAPAYKVQRGTAQNGKIFYAYKDEKKGVAYVGGEAEYQRYQQLAIQKNISDNYYQASVMNQQTAYGWYGAWGPQRFWW